MYVYLCAVWMQASGKLIIFFTCGLTQDGIHRYDWWLRPMESIKNWWVENGCFHIVTSGENNRLIIRIIKIMFVECNFIDSARTDVWILISRHFILLHPWIWLRVRFRVGLWIDETRTRGGWSSSLWFGLLRDLSRCGRPEIGTTLGHIECFVKHRTLARSETCRHERVIPSTFAAFLRLS